VRHHIHSRLALRQNEFRLIEDQPNQGSARERVSLELQNEPPMDDWHNNEPVGQTRAANAVWNNGSRG
jgi:hypothetical protein